MPTALQTPIRRDDAAQQVGPKRYRKQILPVGKVPYEDKELEFSHDYLKRAAAAFNAGAYDQVPFQLADPENRHNMDPEKFRGEITALELADDGLYGIFDLSDDGASLVEKNPKLGVSCRIVQDHPKGPAIQHVLGTLDPRATGMGSWEKLDLAKASGDLKLIDLSDGEFTVPSSATHSVEDTMSTDALTEDQKAALRKRLADDGELTAEEQAEVDAAVKVVLGEDAPAETVALSAEAQATIDLAKSTADEAKDEARKARDELAAEKWKADKADYLRAGVPPSLVNLAEPHLSTASAVIELSNADSQASAMRKMLDEAKGTLDLSERGVVASTDDEDSEEGRARKIAADDKAWGN
jgi:hypothetical protein